MHGILIVYKCGDLSFLKKKKPRVRCFFQTSAQKVHGKVIEVSWPAVLHDRHVCSLCFVGNSGGNVEVEGPYQGTGHVTKAINPRKLVEVCRDQARCEQNNNGCDPWTSILRRAERNPCSMQIFSRQIRTDATHSTWNVAAKCQHILLSLTDDAVFDTSDTMNVSLFLTGKAKTRTGTFVPNISFFNLLGMHGMKTFLGQADMHCSRKTPFQSAPCESGHPRLQLYMYTCSWPEWSTSEQAGNRRFFFGWFWCSWQFGRHFGYLLVWGRSLKVQSSLHLSSLSRDTRVEPSQNFLVFGAWTLLSGTRWAV